MNEDEWYQALKNEVIWKIYVRNILKLLLLFFLIIFHFGMVRNVLTHAM